jgi:hypothetical protein
MANLSHPNVVNVHDTGTVDERVCVAIDLVEGALEISSAAEGFLALFIDGAEPSANLASDVRSVSRLPGTRSSPVHGMVEFANTCESTVTKA